MHRFLFGPLALLILPSALGARDKPKEEEPGAAVEYKILVDEYQTAEKVSDLVFAQAATPQERQAIRATFAQTRSGFVGRFLAFAEAHPKDKEALLALF